MISRTLRTLCLLSCLALVGACGAAEEEPGGSTPAAADQPADTENEAEPEPEPEPEGEPEGVGEVVECPPEAGGGYATCSVDGQVCRRDNAGRDIGATTCRCGDHDGNGTIFWQCQTPHH